MIFSATPKLFLAFIALIFSIFACTFVFAEDDYTLGIGDKVHISVYKNPDLETLTRISASGTINLPLIGHIRVVGVTEKKAEQIIAASLYEEGYVNSPQVSLSVEEYASRQVSVLGRVNQPGKYFIDHRGSTIIDALALAGGVSETGADHVILTKGNQPDSNAIKIDLIQLMEKGDRTLNLKVVDGDVLFIPHMARFYIYGAVDRAGAYRLERNTTVMQAISIAGGLYVGNSRVKGSEKSIQIKRVQPDGLIKTIKVSIEDKVRADDVIRISEGFF